jgi:hypothetical protein
VALWSQVEAAILSWVQAAVPPTWAVVFAEALTGQPQGNTVTIKLGDVLALGAVDDEITSADGSTVTENGMREFPVTLQAFAMQGLTTGDNSPRAVLSLVRQNLELPGPRQALWNAGLSPFDNRGPVRVVALAINTVFEPRAIWECRFYVVEQASASTSWISTVDAGVSAPGPQAPIPGTVTTPGGTVDTYP